MKTFEKIFLIVHSVPKGKVISYGDIAMKIGGISPKIVGFALSSSKDASLPWHRVINSKGELSVRKNSDHHKVQYERLKHEGIKFHQMKIIDLESVRYQFD
jgi:methylated-DNA-protein-cysteine methyltransferase related protein